MFSVYILRDAYSKLYKGVTNNLARRLREHKSGHTTTTARMIDIHIVHTEQYNTFEEARRREVYFKTAAGRRYIKNILRV